MVLPNTRKSWFLLEVLRGDISLVAEPAVDVNDESGKDGKRNSKAEDDGITDSLGHCMI